jgi:hypothetical protein
MVVKRGKRRVRFTIPVRRRRRLVTKSSCCPTARS